jgi:uncharacterized membrane protein
LAWLYVTGILGNMPGKVVWKALTGLGVLFVALAAGVLALVALNKPPYQLDVQYWGKVGVWLLASGATAGVIGILGNALRQSGASGLSVWAKVRKLRLRSPLYTRDQADADRDSSGFLSAAQLEVQRDSFREHLTRTQAELNDSRANLQAVKEEGQQLAAARDEWKAKTENVERDAQALAATALDRDARIGRLTAEAIARDDDLAATRGQRDAALRESRKWFSLYRYGTEFEELPGLGGHTAAAVFASLNQLRPYVERLRETAAAWWEALAEEAREQPEPSPLANLASRIEGWELYHFRSASDLFLETLLFGGDARTSLTAMYLTYRRWRIEARFVSWCIGRQVDAAAYVAWHRAEIAFATDLRRTLTHPALELAARTIQAHQACHGVIGDPLDG